MEKKIMIEISSDEKGYFDRECPNENCLSTFKVNLDDWKEKIKGNDCHCPICGHVADSDSWWTENQLDELRERASSYALSFVQGELNKTFKDLERKTRNGKFIKIKYKPGRKISFNNNPIGQLPEWEQEIECKECGTRYSVIGFSHFCPCCGSNSEVDEFDEALKIEKRKIDSLEKIKKIYSDEYGKDVGASMINSMLEDSFGNVLAAFQSFAYEFYIKLGGKRNVKAKAFQNLERANECFEELLGIKYSDLISDEEYEYINKIFQQRHLLEHRNGKVDQDYLAKTGDFTYSEKERIVIKEKDVYKFLNIIEKLANNLLTYKK